MRCNRCQKTIADGATVTFDAVGIVHPTCARGVPLEVAWYREARDSAEMVEFLTDPKKFVADDVAKSKKR